MLNVGDQIIVRNVQSSTNSDGVENKGYNGTFLVTDIDNIKNLNIQILILWVLHIQ